MSVTAARTLTRVCAGLDWAKDDHVVCVLNADGETITRFTIEHTAAGRSLIGALWRTAL